MRTAMRLAALIGGFLLGPDGVRAQIAGGPDPHLAPGRDPGGVAVALIGGGIDYRRATLAARLARDGEGEAIAFDFVDGDLRPFPGKGAGDDALAGVLAAEAAVARLVIARVPSDRPDVLTHAFGFAGSTPARVAVVVPHGVARAEATELAAAAARLPRLLTVVPARLLLPADRGQAGGVLVVGALATAGQGAPPRADILVATADGDTPAIAEAGRAGRHRDDVAAVRVGALGARLLALSPQLDAAGLKAKILALARRSPQGRIMDDIAILPR